MSLFGSGLVVASFTFLSRIFGLIRELFIAATFGTGFVADSVNVAFKLPNFFRRIFAEGGLALVFVPIFNQKLSESNDSAKKFAGEVFSILVISLFLLIILMEIFMPQVIFVIAPGFHHDPQKYELTILLARITMPYLFFISLVSLYGGILNSVGRFFAFAASPVVMNIIIVLFTYIFQLHTLSQFAISYSLINAGIFQLLLMMISVYRAKMFCMPQKPNFSPDIKMLFLGLGPAILTSGVIQINLLTSQAIASFIPGGISILSYAERMYQFPLSIIGVAFGTILLPKLSRLYKMDERKEANKTLNDAVRFSMFLSIPCCVGIFALSFEIIHIIYQRGAFTEIDSIKTAHALSAFTIGLPAFILSKVLMPAFYAKNDTKTPLKLTIYSLSLNILLNIILMFPLKHVGIALGSSIAAWFNIYLLIRYATAQELIKSDVDISKFLIKTILVSIAMGIIVFYLKHLVYDHLVTGFILLKVIYLLAIIGIGVVIYFTLSIFFGLISKDQLLQLCKRH